MINPENIFLASLLQLFFFFLDTSTMELTQRREFWKGLKIDEMKETSKGTILREGNCKMTWTL